MKRLYFFKGILLCLCLFTGINTFAYHAEIDGIYYNFNGGGIEVTYQNYSNYSYTSDYSGEVVIPESVTYNGKNYRVTSIDDHAFSGCSGLTSITIPNSVTSIGESAFSGCSGLTSITIPNSVTSIGGDAFWVCSSLTSVIIGNGVTEIDENTFFECNELLSVTIGSGVTSISPRAFNNCNSLTKVIVPDIAAWCNISFVDDSANPLSYAHHLYSNESTEITELVIPEGVTGISDYAFLGCSGLTSVTIPESITRIGQAAFAGCSSLTSVHITDLSAWCNISFVSSEANPLSYSHHLYLNGKEIKDLVIPGDVSSVGHYAFSGCSGLTSITIPNSVTSIGYSAFSGCYLLTESFINNSSLTSTNNWGVTLCDEETSDGLLIKDNVVVKCRPWATSVTIPNGVTSIGNSAFSGCSVLTSITIPNSVTSIGSQVFSGCRDLNSIVVEPENPKYDSRDDCNAIIETASNTLIAGCPNTIILNSVTSIGDFAFYNCTSLSSVTIPESVKSIGRQAFHGTSWFDNQPNGVVYAGKFAYSYKGYMPYNITIEDGTLRIADYAFSGCYELSSVTIPNSVISIGNSAFSGCYHLSFTIPNSVTSIGSGAFEGCGMSSVVIPNSVVSIGDYAFSSEELTSVTIGGSVTSIGDYAFSGCNLSSVAIPNSVISIGEGAFNNCNSLTKVIVPDIAAWCNISFGDESANPLSYAHHLYSNKSTEITELVIPEGVTGISDYAFLGCSGLISVTIPNSITNIGDYSFYNCNRLTTVKVERGTPPAINANTFSNRANATLIVPNGCKSSYEAADYWNEFKEILEESVVITIGSTGYATYCSENDLDFSEVSGLNAYIASGFSPSTAKLVLTRVTEVPAGEGLYLVGEPGTYEVPFTETDMIYSNLLKGVTNATTIYPTDGSYTNFILANGSHGVAFYSLSEAGELAAGKAYLQLPTASVSEEVKAIRVIFDDDEDAIQSIAEESQTERIYNLQGQQVNAPKSGLYIVNGKKVFIK